MEGAVLVLREREHVAQRSRPIRQMPNWARVLAPTSLVLVLLTNIFKPDGRQEEVAAMVFVCVGAALGYLGWTVAALVARISVTESSLVIRMRYRLRATRIPRAEIRRLVLCTILGSLRYPVLLVIGSEDRCLAQIAFDHYSDEDLTAASGALGVSVEGTWDYEPSIPELQTMFPGFRRVNLSSRAAVLWLVPMIIGSAAAAWFYSAGITG